MTASLMPQPIIQELTNAGAPLAGGKLYTAQAGTVAGPSQSFPRATYTDGSALITNTNPVILDSAGRASVWLNGSYSMALYDANDVLIWTQDGVQGSAPYSGATTAVTSFIFSDATAATQNVSILSANDPSAPDVYEVSKVDDSANLVTLTPATGTIMGAANFSLEGQGESIRLKKYTAGNDWMRGD